MNPRPADPSRTDWHALSADEAMDRLASGPGGLTDDEVRRRQEEYGPNRLAPPRPVAWWTILARQFASVVVLLLAVAAGVALVLGDRLEAAAIGVVLALNTGIGFVVELRARRAMAALLRYEVPEARVVRGGERKVVPAAQLVPGDVVELEAGDAVPADARIVEGADLRVEEAALTGESVPTGKGPEAVDATTPLADRRSMVFTGTTAVAGGARAVVVAIGSGTELGRVGELLASVETGRSPLERRLDALGHRLVWLTLAIAAVVTGVGVLRGEEWVRMLETGVALAIAAVPEGLPAVATIALAVGLTRMAARNALVRRLGAVEALGSTTVVCTDKTGTLTAGRMVVRRVVGLDLDLRVEGRGYEPEGRLLADGSPVGDDVHPALARLLTAAALTPTASIDTERLEVAGDPTDAALLVLAARGGRPRKAMEAEGDVRVFPFSGDLLVGAAVRNGETFVKGAPARVLDASSRVAGPEGDREWDDEARTALEAANETLAEEGLRVIALAWTDRAVSSLSEVDDLVFLGFVGILDPPAEGVPETIERLRTAGIRTVMITGDQKATATAVARELGLLEADGGEVLDGTQLDALSEADLEDRVARAAVFARTTPEEKVRIVDALQARREIVAMLGDGVNDAAALRKADVGVAMGERGTDLARETASIVLQDDRFATVGVAVEEGRVIYDNIRKFVFYLFSCNLAEVLVLLAAGVAGLPLPLLPLQILWLNLVTDTFPALALAMEPAEPDVMTRAPRAPDAPILSRRFLGGLGFYAALITASTLAAWGWGLTHGTADDARTLAFSTLALAQLFHLGNARRRRPVLRPEAALANRWALAAIPVVVGLQVAAVTWEPLRTVLGTRPLDAAEWGLVAGLALVPAVVGQVIEVIQERRGRPEAVSPA